MPTLILYNSTVQEITGKGVNHTTVGDPQLIACTSVADATTKLQTALTPLVGSGPAATHATNFQARQTSGQGTSKHVMNFGNAQGATATYRP